jgi:predicted secreted protein
MLRRMLAGCIAGLFLLPPAMAAERGAPRYNLVELQAEAQREVQNDLLNATLFVELKNSSPAALADAINKTVNEALAVAKRYKDVTVRSGSNHTFPVTSNNFIEGWRGRAEIQLQSRHFEAATELIGKLQGSMQLGSMNFSVSPAARRTVENELISEAIAAFRARAELARAALGGRGYKLQRLNLGNGQMMPRFNLAAMAVRSVDAATKPDVEAGMSVIMVTAAGAIEVIE